MNCRTAVITVSDKGSRGEREDTSGPAVCAAAEKAGWSVAYTAIIPDEADVIRSELIKCSDVLGLDLVLTTGGTGFSPRDVTPEATLSVTDRETRGIPEAMRARSMLITPRGCLSRAAAGIRGRTLIVNLPGSKKAALENLEAVTEAICHGVEMLQSSGSADCASPEAAVAAASPPSLDEWLRLVKASPDAARIGMYLVHNGVVREDSRAKVRSGDDSAPPVAALTLSYDTAKLASAIDETRAMPGIYCVKVWIASGRLKVGNDMMRVLVGGDIRPHVSDALLSLVEKIKSECVEEKELF